jgi:hypothetical protein
VLEAVVEDVDPSSEAALDRSADGIATAADGDDHAFELPGEHDGLVTRHVGGGQDVRTIADDERRPRNEPR